MENPKKLKSKVFINWLKSELTEFEFALEFTEIVAPKFKGYKLDKEADKRIKEDIELLKSIIP